MNLFHLLKECTRDTVKKLLHSYFPFPLKVSDDALHLNQTMQWLIRACDNGKGAVSSHYSLISGKWLKPFPETTGYIIPTLFNYSNHSGDRSYFKIALTLADWLCEVQLLSGACMQGTFNPRRDTNKPIIFNTGQNIFGFLRAYQETGTQKYMDSAIRAGNFLVENTDRKKIWTSCLHNNIPHAYNSRTCWALLELYELKPRKEYKDIAISNLNWVISQQNKNGWFRSANFKPGELPNTHGLAYTIRGLLESYQLTQDPVYLTSAKNAADRFLRLFEIRKFIYTFWDEKWRNHGKFLRNTKGKYICLTGNIQFSIIWMRLYQITGDYTYLNSAFKMLDFIKTLQNIKSKKVGINGGIKGAFPVYGSYSIFKYPNWAAKFFADALMMKTDLMKTAL